MCRQSAWAGQLVRTKRCSFLTVSWPCWQADKERLREGHGLDTGALFCLQESPSQAKNWQTCFCFDTQGKGALGQAWVLAICLGGKSRTSARIRLAAGTRSFSSLQDQRLAHDLWQNARPGPRQGIWERTRKRPRERTCLDAGKAKGACPHGAGVVLMNCAAHRVPMGHWPAGPCAPGPYKNSKRGSQWKKQTGADLQER